MLRLFQNPINVLSRLLVLRIVKLFSLPGSLYHVYNVLMSITPTLITQVGLLPTLRTLRRIGNVINQRALEASTRTRGQSALTIEVIHGVLNNMPGINPYVLDKVLRDISPYFDDCVKYIKFFNIIFKIFFFIGILGLLRPVYMFLIRPLFSLVISALTIFYNEVLSGIKVLRDFAEIIVFLLENYLGFKLPRYYIVPEIVQQTIEETLNKEFVEKGILDYKNNIVVEESNAHKYFRYGIYTIIAVVTVTFAVTATLVVGDNIQATHELVHKLPKVDSVLNPIYDTGNYIVSKFNSIFGSNQPTVGGTPGTVGNTGSASTSGTATPITIGDNRTLPIPPADAPVPAPAPVASGSGSAPLPSGNPNFPSSITRTISGRNAPSIGQVLDGGDVTPRAQTGPLPGLDGVNGY